MLTGCVWCNATAPVKFDVRVQSAACLLLTNASLAESELDAGGLARAERIAEAGGIEAITNAIKSFLDSFSVLDFAFGAISNVTCGKGPVGIAPIELRSRDSTDCARRHQRSD